MSENQNQSPQKTDDQEKTSIGNDPRFWIAAVLILGMLTILTVAVLQGQYVQVTQLAGIFSGWITSIIAFYFYTQTNTQLQNQSKTSAQSEAQAHQKAEVALQRAQTAEKKVHIALGMITGSEPTIKIAEVDRARAAQVTMEKIKIILEQE